MVDEQVYSWLDAGGRQWSDVRTGRDATGMLACLMATAGSKFVAAGFIQRDEQRGRYMRSAWGLAFARSEEEVFKRLRPRIEGQAGSADRDTGGGARRGGGAGDLGSRRACSRWGRISRWRVSRRDGLRRRGSRGAGAWRIEGMQLEWDAMGQF